MKKKILMILLFQSSFLYSISDPSILLQNKSVFGISIGESKPSYYDNTKNHIVLIYKSNIINLEIGQTRHLSNLYQMNFSIGHTYFFNKNTLSNFWYSYSDWKKKRIDIWKGPQRRFEIYFTHKFSSISKKNLEFFTSIGANYVDTNHINTKSINVAYYLVYSIKNFTITPWISIARNPKADKAFKWIGLQLRYNLILNK